MCNSFMYFKWRLYAKIALLISCINGSNYQSHFVQTGSLEQVTSFSFWEESCDWSQSINKQFIDGVFLILIFDV